MQGFRLAICTANSILGLHQAQYKVRWNWSSCCFLALVQDGPEWKFCLFQEKLVLMSLKSTALNWNSVSHEMRQQERRCNNISIKEMVSLLWRQHQDCQTPRGFLYLTTPRPLEQNKHEHTPWTLNQEPSYSGSRERILQCIVQNVEYAETSPFMSEHIGTSSKRQSYCPRTQHQDSLRKCQLPKQGLKFTMVIWQNTTVDYFDFQRVRDTKSINPASLLAQPIIVLKLPNLWTARPTKSGPQGQGKNYLLSLPLKCQLRIVGDPFSTLSGCP